MKTVRFLRRLGQFSVKVDTIPLTFMHDEDLMNPLFMNSIEVPTRIISMDEDSITSLISSYVSPKSLLNAYEKYQKHISINHCVLILRIIARFPDLVRPYQHDTVFLSQMYGLVNQVNEQMLDLNEIDLIDILFWIRKMVNGSVFNAGPKFLNQARFHSCIEQMLQENRYSLRYLINVYFDYTFLGKNTQKVSEQLLKALQDPKERSEINFISVLTITKSSVQRMFYLRNMDTLVTTAFLDFALSIINESDLIQQSSLLVDVSKVRWYLQDPYFKVHPLMLNIEENMWNNLDKLQEITVLQILESYACLPINFPGRLLEDLQKIILQTAQFKPHQMRFDFLLKMITHLLNLKKSQLNQQCLDCVVKLMLEKIEGDHYLIEREQKYNELILDLVHEKFVLDLDCQKVFERMSLQKIRQIPSLFILQKLFHKENLSPQIREQLLVLKSNLDQHIFIDFKDKDKQKDILIGDDQEKISLDNLFILGILFEQYQIPMERLRQIVYNQILYQPNKLFICTHCHNPTQWIEDVFIKTSLAYQDAILQKTVRNDSLRQVPRSIFNEKTLNLWQDWVLTNQEILRKEQIFEKFFTCQIYANDFRQIPKEGYRFYKFLLQTFERDIYPSFIFVFMRNQPVSLCFILRESEEILYLILRKLQFYKTGSEFVKLIHLLENNNLHHLINVRDLKLQYHYGFSNTQKFNNQVIYLMIKYCCLPTNQLNLVYNNLLSQNDNELKILLLMINMFHSMDTNSDTLQKMIIVQANKFCKLYDHE